MSLRWLPNAICIARMALVAPVVYALLRGEYLLTLVLFGAAGVSDGIDGWLAKTFGWTSALGEMLDPIADKLLLVTAFLTLAWLGLAPWWLTGAVVLRDVVIVSGAIAYRVLVGGFEGRPTLVSKLNTLVQLCYVVAVIGGAAWHGMPGALVTVIGAACFVTTVVSGLDYVIRYSRLALRAGRRPAASG
jgi:cardiolipin synthase